MVSSTANADPCGLNLPQRSAKPRTKGLTAITDKGRTLAELEANLVDFGCYLDIAKLGVGSAYVTPNLAAKVVLYRRYNVIPYFGGTLFEKFLHAGKLDAYPGYLRDYGIDWVEISAGVLDLTLDDRLAMVERFRREGFTVLSEVGCKDSEKVMSPSQWIREIKAFIGADCAYVITEGRDSGTAGIYRGSGEIRTGLVADILESVDPARIIFEAPSPSHQMFFINNVGPEVNLGNVSLDDLILLESQRVGLRYETFYLGQK